jgi:hypothetical protein
MDFAHYFRRIMLGEIVFNDWYWEKVANGDINPTPEALASLSLVGDDRAVEEANITSSQTIISNENA